MTVYEGKVTYNKRGTIEGKKRLERPHDVVQYMQGAIKDPLVEFLWVILVTARNRPMARFLVGQGGTSSCAADPSSIFRPAVLQGAYGIVLVHNHPSGDPDPSMGDIAFTKKIRESGDILKIVLRDHVILGTKEEDPKELGYYSFSDAGLI